MAGENGRPHQAALVRSLRKHPSYWTRPIDLITGGSRREGGNQIVDIDETLPSNEDESTQDDPQQYEAGELTWCVEDQTHIFVETGISAHTSFHFVSTCNPNSENHSGIKGRLGLFRRSRSKDGEGIEVNAPVSADLVTLIRNQDWHSVLARLDLNPHEAKEELRVATRGGFQSTKGFLPLHYACERRPPVEVVDALISACPAAVATRSMPGGCLPLHIACTWYAPAGAVNALLVSDRSSCKVQDELGNVALHSACFSGTASEVVESLLRAYPKASLSRNHQGSLPEDICKRLRHENRRSLMALLNLCKEEVLAGKHGRSESSGTMGAIAKSAIALNER